MRLDNSPLIIFFSTVALTTLAIDFSIALLVNLPVYIIVQIWVYLTKKSILEEVGYYDNTWKVEEALTIRPSSGGRPPLAFKVIGIFLILGMIGMVYLFVHLTFLHSEQLWFLKSIPFLGALFTIGIMWVADIILTVITRTMVS